MGQGPVAKAMGCQLGFDAFCPEFAGAFGMMILEDYMYLGHGSFELGSPLSMAGPKEKFLGHGPFEKGLVKLN